jgi:uncharacterized protein (PEP-CTERM system associated)
MIATTVESIQDFILPLRERLNFLSILCALMFSPAVVQAEDWKIIPSVDLTETYTDNLRLQTKGHEESAFITQASPGIIISRNGARFKLDLNYVLQNSYYSGNQHDTRTNNLLHADAKASLIEDLFFLDSRADITQQNLTPFGQVADANFNLIDNRTEVRTYSFAPYFRKNFNNQFSSELRYVRDSATSSRQGNIDSKGDTFKFSVVSGTAFKVVDWGFSYDNQHIDYVSQAPLKMEVATINADFRLSPVFKLTATSGYEKNSYISLNTKPEGFFWTGGFVWTPTERTNFTANIGHRYFGSTSSVSISQRARTSVWSLGYHEDVATTRGQYLLPATNDTANFLNQLWQSIIPDQDTRQRIVDNFIRDAGLPTALAQPVNTLTNQVFLQKNLQASVAITGVRNTALLNFFNNSREALSSGALESVLNQGLSNNVRQLGANALWNWKISERSNATLDLGYIKSDSPNSGIKEHNKIFRTSFSRQLQEKVKATLEFRRVLKDSNLASGNYDENAVTFYLLIGFN